VEPLTSIRFYTDGCGALLGTGTDGTVFIDRRATIKGRGHLNCWQLVRLDKSDKIDWISMYVPVCTSDNSRLKGYLQAPQR